MKRRLLTLAVAACLLFTFTACGGGTQTSPTPTVETKTQLVMGTNVDFPPYEMYQDGVPVGIDVEIAGAIAEKLGLELVIDDMEFGALIMAVESGTIDMAMAGMTVTPEREESVSFTTSYATGIQSIIVREDSDIAAIEDLEGKKIGVQLSTTGDIYASDVYGIDNVQKYDKGSMAVLALTEGVVDCVIIDNEPAKAFVAANEGLKILDVEYEREDYAIAVNKENTELLGQINGALEELIADGTVQTIIDKYIKSE